MQSTGRGGGLLCCGLPFCLFFLFRLHGRRCGVAAYMSLVLLAPHRAPQHQALPAEPHPTSSCTCTDGWYTHRSGPPKKKKEKQRWKGRPPSPLTDRLWSFSSPQDILYALDLTTNASALSSVSSNDELLSPYAFLCSTYVSRTFPSHAYIRFLSYISLRFHICLLAVSFVKVQVGLGFVYAIGFPCTQHSST